MVRARGSLHRAAFGGHHAIVKLLLEHQADVNIQDRRGTARDPVASGGAGWGTGYLSATAEAWGRCSIQKENGWDCLALASQQWTSRYRAGFTCPRRRCECAGGTTFGLHCIGHHASGYLEIVQSLVRHGAALDKTSSTKKRRSTYASRVGNLKIARFLIEQGANTMSKDKDGWTPLHKASRHGHLDLVEMLLEGGVDVNVRNADEGDSLRPRIGPWEPRGCSLPNQAWSGCELLRQARLDSSPHSSTKMATLTRAAVARPWYWCPGPKWESRHSIDVGVMGGHVEVSRFLIEHQADVNSVSTMGAGRRYT
jgi:hypothetical protein